ncbi:MAG: hypothetical protein KJP07_14320 [Desulfatitalea sp.]|nr:hypothetical protein [Desulfatitalea sp.]
MFVLMRMMLIFLIIYLPLPLMACGPETQIVKKPEGLRMIGDANTSYRFNSKDRQKWKSVLNWCDECDERAKPFTESDDGINGGMYIYPIGDNQYIVDIKCKMTMRQCEHIYYKVTEHADTIESRLLILELFYHAEYDDNDVKGVTNRKGEFVRSFDSVAYGFTTTFKDDKFKDNQKLLIVEVEYRGMGGCGLYTVYDVSGDCPKVVEFRAKVECTPETPVPTQYELYPPEQRAKWRIVPNPRRHGWKPSSSASPVCTK